MKKIFFGGLFLSLFFACKNTANEAIEIDRNKINIEKGTDVEIIYSDSAKVKVRVTGPEMLYHTQRSAPRQEFTKGVVTYFYDKLGNETSVLTGKYAIRDEQKKQVVIRDSVVWVSLADGRLETSELIWDEATNVIRSTKFTKIMRQNEMVYGFNFETNSQLTNWRLLLPKGSMKMGNLQQNLEE